MEILTPEQAAAMLHIRATTLSTWRWKRVGPAYLKCGGQVLYRESDILAWAESQRVVPGEAKVNGADADVEQIQS